MFEIKLANGTEAKFDSAEEMSNWYERMVPRVKKPKDNKTENQQTSEKKQ